MTKLIFGSRNFVNAPNQQLFQKTPLAFRDRGQRFKCSDGLNRDSNQKPSSGVPCYLVRDGLPKRLLQGIGCTAHHTRYRLYRSSHTVQAVPLITHGIGCTAHHTRYRLYRSPHTVQAVPLITYGTGCTAHHIRYRLYRSSHTVQAVPPITYGTGCTAHHINTRTKYKLTPCSISLMRAQCAR